MRGLLDASIICTLLFDDDGATEIAAWIITSLPDPLISTFAWGETVGAMGVKVRSGTIRADTASRLLATFAEDITRWHWSETIAADISTATEYILELTRPLRFADAVHIATAKRLNMTLISTDRQQVAAAVNLSVAVFNPLERPQ